MNSRTHNKFQNGVASDALTARPFERRYMYLSKHTLPILVLLLSSCASTVEQSEICISKEAADARNPSGSEFRKYWKYDVQSLKVPVPKKQKKLIESGIVGYVILETTISRSGVPEDIVVVDSYPEGVFDDFAIYQREQTRFISKLCSPIPIRLRTPHKFIDGPAGERQIDNLLRKKAHVI
ncbi:MAG: hypothetical protein AAF431_12360 [Pseudomonadota bacterium]